MRRRAIWLLALVPLCMPALLAGQQTRPAGSGRGRTIGGHLFIPSSTFADPFVASYVRSLIGAGQASNLQVPIYNVSDSLVTTLQGDLSFLEIDLEYQQRVLGWLALRVNAAGLAR